jgi:hypothetical protein
MDIVEILRQDYQRFPRDQTYSIYAPDVYFQDPLTCFRGVARYQQMIRFIQTWFIDTRMELDEMQQSGNQIHTRWSLRWVAPVPWRPAMAISGRSELQLNAQGLISSHIDYWDCSRLAVLRQLFRTSVAPN